MVKGADAYWQQRVTDARYWREEARHAFKERDEIKRSLEAVDTAGYWRKQARDARGREDTIRKRLTALTEKAREATDRLALLHVEQAATKRALWDVFSEMDEGPLKAKLWAIWSAMVVPSVDTDTALR